MYWSDTVETASHANHQITSDFSGQHRPISDTNLNVDKRVQLDATICRHLFTAKSLYMFRASQHPSSGALKTVTTTSGIGHTVQYKLKIN